MTNQSPAEIIRQQLTSGSRPFDSAAVSALLAERDHLAGTNAILRGLLSEFTDDEPCGYDHHGYCQTHALSAHPCRNARAHQLIGAYAATHAKH